jgi:hypothetical protein
MDPLEKIGRCREYAARYVEIQREEFKRLGVFGDWKHPYVTMEPAYQATIVREFGRFVGRGTVYKGLKPVHCKTALAQAEVEYEDQRTPSIYVKFGVKTPSGALAAGLGSRRAALVIWTTTPWTLPANLAIAVHPGETYTAVEVDGEALVVARALAPAFLELPAGWSASLQASVKGLATHELHDQGERLVRLFEPVDLRDVRVIERGEGARFALEPAAALRVICERVRQDLHGDIATELGIACQVHFAHPAGADRGGDFVGAEPRAGCQRHADSAALYGQTWRQASDRL